MKMKKQWKEIYRIYERGEQDERGTLLFLVLFLVSALMIAGAVLLQISLAERTISENYELKIRAHYIAETGAEVAMLLLNKQPDYFLQCSDIENPVYLKRGEEEEYFILEWLEPGNPEGNEDYYTLVSSGYYRHAVKRKEAEAVLRAFIELTSGFGADDSEDDANGDNENNAEDMGSEICGENSADLGESGNSCNGCENSGVLDNAGGFEEDKNPAGETAVEAILMGWSGW